MTEKISLWMFWSAMLICAVSVLAMIWLEPVSFEKIPVTFFIIGLASFLIWVPLVIYRFLAKLS
ncbi:MAG: hypothetical protein ACJKTH_03240 [Patescibacteria group bacterium UBA2163]